MRVVSSPNRVGRAALSWFSLRSLVASCARATSWCLASAHFSAGGARAHRVGLRVRIALCGRALARRRVRASRRRAHSRTWLCRRPPRGSFLWRGSPVVLYSRESSNVRSASLSQPEQRTGGGTRKRIAENLRERSKIGSVLGPRERERVRRAEGPVVAAAVAPRRRRRRRRQVRVDGFFRGDAARRFAGDRDRRAAARRRGGSPAPPRSASILLRVAVTSDFSLSSFAMRASSLGRSRSPGGGGAPHGRRSFLF